MGRRKSSTFFLSFRHGHKFGKCIWINASGVGQNVNESCSKNKSDIVDQFSSNSKKKNTFSNPEAHFFVAKGKGDFSKTSPLLIQKAIQSNIGELGNIKKLRSKEFLIEVQSSTQASNIKKCNLLANIPIIVSMHRSLNSTKEVISEADMQYVPKKRNS